VAGRYGAAAPHSIAKWSQTLLQINETSLSFGRIALLDEIAASPESRSRETRIVAPPLWTL
jgi:hypothetical protein